jgi:cob(I)alamin adenosyltransferase
MSIVTKRGDRGKTSLCCGKMVGKDDARIEACGALDEASSFLGLAKNASKDNGTKKIIHSIQKELIVLGSEIVTTATGLDKLKRRIDKDSVRALEKEIEYLEGNRAVKMTSFSVSGRGAASSALDVARAVVRRAERRIVTLARKGMIDNPYIIVYLNRLSDLLYLLARHNERKSSLRGPKGRSNLNK